MDGRDFKTVSRAVWEAMAQGWDERHAYMDEVARPVTERMMERLDPAPGDEVLEIACGTGIAGFAAATVVGDNGRVILGDFAQGMVDAASRHATEMGLANVECRVLDAESLDLPDDSVDGVICRWGYMLMGDPAAALRETRRVLRNDGTVAAAVFSGPESNPWAALPARVLIERGHMPPPQPGAPGILSLADPERIRSLFRGAGLGEPRIEAVDFSIPASDFDDYWEIVTRVAGALAMVIERQEPGEQESIRTDLAQRVERFAVGEGLDIPAQSLVISAP